MEFCSPQHSEKEIIGSINSSLSGKTDNVEANYSFNFGAVVFLLFTLLTRNWNYQSDLC